MPNEYKIFLLESIVLSAIFTVCCTSGSNRFQQEFWACRLKTVRARGNPYIYRLFGFEMFRIKAIFIHSTTNGYRHLKKSGRALHIKNFRFKIFRINALFIHSTTNGYRDLMKSGRAACRPIEGEEIPTYRDFSVFPFVSSLQNLHFSMII